MVDKSTYRMVEDPDVKMVVEPMHKYAAEANRIPSPGKSSSIVTSAPDVGTPATPSAPAAVPPAPQPSAAQTETKK